MSALTCFHAIEPKIGTRNLIPATVKGKFDLVLHDSLSSLQSSLNMQNGTSNCCKVVGEKKKKGNCLSTRRRLSHTHSYTYTYIHTHTLTLTPLHSHTQIYKFDINDLKSGCFSQLLGREAQLFCLWRHSAAIFASLSLYLAFISTFRTTQYDCKTVRLTHTPLRSHSISLHF